jgi:hypothetical protein
MLRVLETSSLIEAALRAAPRVSEAGQPIVVRALPADEAGTGRTVFLAAGPLMARGIVPEQGGVLLIGPRALLAHGEPVAGMVQRGYEGRIALFGTHAWPAGGVGLARRHRVQAYPMTEITREGLRESTDAMMTYVRTWPSCHVCVDLAVLEPAFAPGLEGALAGGFTVRELLYVLQRVLLIKTVVSVEIALAGRDDPLTAAVCGKVIAEAVAGLTQS